MINLARAFENHSSGLTVDLAEPLLCKIVSYSRIQWDPGAILIFSI